MGGLVSSPNIIMANISKPLSILFLLFAIANGLRIRKRIKIPKHGTNSSHNAKTYVSQRPRETRFLNPFSLFNIITFSNTECTTSSGTLGGKLEQLYKIRQHFKTVQKLTPSVLYCCTTINTTTTGKLGK